MSSQVLSILEAEKDKHGKYVFTFRGKPVKRANTRAFKKALTKAGLPAIRWHELRHTFAS